MKYNYPNCDLYLEGSANMEKKLRFDFNDKLNKEDTEEQTLGCRQKNPNICSCNGIENICAFASYEGICKKPSRAWKKQFEKLSKESGETK